VAGVLHANALCFAHDLSDLLNNTVCTGVRMKSVAAEPSRVVVGYGISRNQLDATQGIGLTIGRKPPSAYLGVSYRLILDSSGRYLAVHSSFLGLFLDCQLQHALMHYDYERDKGDGYPEAHLQVRADANVWNAMCDKRGAVRPLQRLHFPVGGRRYRPTLEDLIDFTISEGIADAHPQAGEHISRGRERFQEMQLRAAVRRNPEPAIAILREIGHI
jgi:hypothetical protein